MTVKNPGRVGKKLKRLSNRSSVLSRSLSSLASYATWVVLNHIDMPERAHWSRIFRACQMLSKFEKFPGSKTFWTLNFLW